MKRKKTKSARSKSASRTKTVLKKTKSATVKTKSSNRRSKNMAKKRKIKARHSKVTGILNNPTLKKVMIGIGAGSLAGTVTGMVAPQFTGIAKPLVALAVGGPIGAVASILADGGISGISGILGNTTPNTGVSV